MIEALSSYAEDEMHIGMHWYPERQAASQAAYPGLYAVPNCCKDQQHILAPFAPLPQAHARSRKQFLEC